jgi:hypothetical protein
MASSGAIWLGGRDSTPSIVTWGAGMENSIQARLDARRAFRTTLGSGDVHDAPVAAQAVHATANPG